MRVLFTLLVLFVFLEVSAQKDTVSYQEILNLSYLSPEEVTVDSLQRLNLVLPTGVKNPPLFIWIGGGAWSFVNRHVEMNLARKFAREGIAVASVGHQLSKGSFADSTRTYGIKHPEHIKDVAAAFKWLLDQASVYGYDPNHLIVGGYSSGAHLAALLAMDPKYLEAHNLNLDAIKAIIPVSGTYDIPDYYSVFAEHENPESRILADTHVKDVFGSTNAHFVDASPVTYLDQLNLPMLLISDRGLYNYTKLFETKLREAQYRNCQVFHVFNLNHGELWRDLSNAPNSQTRNLMIDFIKRHSIG